MTEKRTLNTGSTRLFDDFDDTDPEEFLQKALNGEFNSDEEAIAYLKENFKKSILSLNSCLNNK